MHPDLTVIYYTSNREKPAFEAKIRLALLNVIGSTPLISVSQQPMDFGTNICVGDVGQSGANAIRQFQIGAMAAHTRYVCSAESDFLYAPERFVFCPEREDVFYGLTNWYVLFFSQSRGARFVKKFNRPLGPITCGRDLLIRSVDLHLERFGSPWSTDTTPRDLPNFYALAPRLRRLTTVIPSVSFKTDENMHAATANAHRHPLYDIPYWGSAQGLVDTYLMATNG